MRKDILASNGEKHWNSVSSSKPQNYIPDEEK
jgi:hypothetical protein